MQSIHASEFCWTNKMFFFSFADMVKVIHAFIQKKYSL